MNGEEEKWLDNTNLNIDGATFFNMLDGMPYEKAAKEARGEFVEMERERNPLPATGDKK